MTSAPPVQDTATGSDRFHFRQRLTPYLVLTGVSLAYLVVHWYFFDGPSLIWFVLAYLVYAIIRTRATVYEVTPTHFIRRRPWRTVEIPWIEVERVEPRDNFLGKGVAIVRGLGVAGVLQVTFVESPETTIPRLTEAFRRGNPGATP